MGDAVREKHREIHNMHQDAEDIEVSTEESDVLRLKVFNCNSV